MNNLNIQLYLSKRKYKCLTLNQFTIWKPRHLLMSNQILVERGKMIPHYSLVSEMFNERSVQFYLENMSINLNSFEKKPKIYVLDLL